MTNEARNIRNHKGNPKAVLSNSHNSGKQAEAYQAIVKRCKYDGCPNQPDLIINGKVCEVKYFSEYITKQFKVQQNPANGFALDNRPIREQLRDYVYGGERFRGFSRLYIGHGERNGYESAEWMSLNQDEAYQFLEDRVSLAVAGPSCERDMMRFCWGGKQVHSRKGGRVANFEKHGYIW